MEDTKEITEVVAVVDLNPGSTLNIPMWGVVWINLEKHRAWASWPVTECPEEEDWMQRLVGRVAGD